MSTDTRSDWAGSYRYVWLPTSTSFAPCTTTQREGTYTTACPSEGVEDRYSHKPGTAVS